MQLVVTLNPRATITHLAHHLLPFHPSLTHPPAPSPAPTCPPTCPPRDIKPENIFFSRDGDMKLGDFGLAIDAACERPKSRVGTLDYMAPEVVCLPTADERRRMEREGRPLREADMPTYSEKVGGRQRRQRQMPVCVCLAC